MEAKQQAFIEKLEEIFQINNGLDFGIYRIINEKKSDIETYIKNTLPEKINEFLEDLKTVSVDNSDKIKEISQLQQPILSGNVEEEIYDKLLTFFSRYYDEGDFISQRRYKDGVYAVPYSGEEVKLHWANYDQYYIKTGENFKDYTFNIEDNFNVTFILTDAEIERDNNKADDKKVYVLAEPSEEYEKPVYVLENEGKSQAELFIRLSYRYGKDISRKECIEVILNSVKQLENDNEISSNIKSKIGNLFKSRNEKNKNKESHLEYHLNKYISKNSFDFFIHKDLKKFLMQELDFYIKNEVIYLQDLYGSVDNIKNLDMYVKKARVIQHIGSEIIEFLAQLEDFQKELYLKKKFITETNYCVTLDKINEKYYDEIIANKLQLEEWKKLFAIDEIKGDLHTEAYSEPLTKEFLKENEYLVLDTAFFSEEFKEKIIADIENLDENIDGLLIHGDNFQALNILQEKYKEQVQCVYIDPPYNTKNRDFNYKDNYKHSSWLAMMYDRLEKITRLGKFDGYLFCSIDDNENKSLLWLLKDIFGENNYLNAITWEKRTKCQNTAYAKNMLQSKIEYIHPVTFSKIPHMFNLFTNVEKQYDLEDEKGKYRLYEIGQMSREGMRGRDTMIFEINGILPKEGNQWKIGIKEVEYYQSQGRLVIKNNVPYIIMRPEDEDNFSYKPFWSHFFDKEVYGTAETGLSEVANDFGFGRILETIKPYDLIYKILYHSTKSSSLILDFFAGSGTTGHAVVNLNREDNGKRKYILVEMGEYFDTVTKPRIEKVIYSKDWKDGKPLSREGSSHIFKYIRLESYEDTLNNVEFSKHLVVDDFLQNEYLTKYKIQKETESSKIYLPAEVFYNPFEFQLKITRKNENRVQKIDLVETFNFLIGLKVNNIYTKKYNAEFKKVDTGRLQAEIKLDYNGQYIFKIVEGFTLKGDKVLVIWRNIVGDINNNDDLNKNNAVLESVTLKNHIKPTDSEYDIIYINCTNSLQNFAKEGSYKVALIEEVMKDKMFNGI